MLRSRRHFECRLRCMIVYRTGTQIVASCYALLTVTGALPFGEIIALLPCLQHASLLFIAVVIVKGVVRIGHFEARQRLN